MRIVRGAGSGTPLKIDEIKEIATPDYASALEALRGEIGSVEGVLMCAIRPALVELHVATPSEVSAHAGPAGVDAFLRGRANAGADDRWVAAADAGGRGGPRSSRWMAAMCTAVEFQRWQGILSGLQLKPRAVVSGVFTTAGALVGEVNAPTLVLEIGDAQSHGILVDREGIAGAAALTLNRDRISEVVQTILGLKFRGSAGKLFFNPEYDFSEVAPQIAAAIAQQLKPELGALWQGRSAAAALCCPTLPAGQQWFVAQLASALGLSVYAPDVTAWTATAGMTLPPKPASGVPSAWLPVLHAFRSQVRAADGATSWQPEWRALNRAGDAAKAAPVLPPAAATPVATKPAAPIPAKPPVTIPPVPVIKPGATIPPTASAASTATIPPTPPAKTAPPAPPARPAPAAVAAKAATPAPTAKGNGGPGKKGQPAATPKPAAPVVPTSAASSVSYPPKSESVASSAGSAAASERAPRKNRLPVALIAVAALLIVGLVGWFVIKSQKDEAARLAAEKVRSEQRLKEEQERARLAEKKVAEEAAARQKTEQELAQKLAASESARQQAEEEARRQAAARAANARGTIVVTTEPKGATVTVGTLPAKTSPATFSDVRTGRYPVTVALDHYDAVKFEVEVRENETTTPAKVVLARVVGTLEIACSPGTAAFELSPANAMFVDLKARKTGRTPATVENLTPGEYVVTLTRDGWAPHQETVTVARNATARVSWALATGNVKLTSEPAGAKVRRDGREIGVTPLALDDQPPGAVEYEFVRDDFDRPVTAGGQIEAGKSLNLVARFADDDRLYAARDLTTKPTTGANKPPVVPYYMTLENPRIDFEVTVYRDGTLRNFRVLQSSHKDLARFCIDALGKWKYKPATIAGKPVSTRITLSLTQFAAAE